MNRALKKVGCISILLVTKGGLLLLREGLNTKGEEVQTAGMKPPTTLCNGNRGNPNELIPKSSGLCLSLISIAKTLSPAVQPARLPALHKRSIQFYSSLSIRRHLPKRGIMLGHPILRDKFAFLFHACWLCELCKITRLLNVERRTQSGQS
jgi:hypothetical protein